MARPRKVSRPLFALAVGCVLSAIVLMGVGFGLEHWFTSHDRRQPYNPLVSAMSHLHEYDSRGIWILRGLGAALALAGIVLARVRPRDSALAPLPLGMQRGRGLETITRADFRTWASTIGWTLVTAGVLVSAFGWVAGQIVADRTLVEWSKWFGGVVLAPLALLLPLLVFRYYFTFFTTVSTAGVFVGSMALVVVLSVMSGFENDLQDKILGSNAHIRVTRDEGVIADWQPILERVKQVPGVVAATPYATTEVVISANSNYNTVIIKGIDPDSVGSVTDLVKDIEGDAREDAAAMKRLYPLREDKVDQGPVGGDAGTPDAAPPGDGGVTDPAPDDFGSGDAPDDYSAGEPDVDAGARPARPAVVDPAPTDFEDDEDAPETFDAPADPGEDAPARVPDPDTDVAPRAGEKVPMPGNSVRLGDLIDADLQRDLRRDRDEPAFADEPSEQGRLALLDGLLAGKELVKTLHLYVGQEVRLVSPLADPSNPDATGTPIPFHRDYRIAGTFYTGMYEYDLKYVYVPLESLQEFLQLGDVIDGIEIRITDPDDTGAVRARIQQVLGPGYLVQDWKELNRNLFSALKLEKIAMFLVLAIIILVASFSIVGNLIMVVVEKGKEIALLKTLGASDFEVMFVFVMQGFFIGLVGTLAGVLEGLMICLGCQELGFPINPDVYYIKTLPIHVDAPSVALVAIAGLLISAIATVYPAVVAARLRPAVGLRHD